MVDADKSLEPARPLLSGETEGGEDVLQVVGFLIGDEEYAVDILDVVGVERLDNVVRLPRMPAFVEGVMTIRDEAVALIKLRARFNLDERPNDDQTRVVVIESGEHTLGFIVDAVTSVRRLPRPDVEAVPPVALTIDSRFVTGLVRAAGRTLIILNPRTILFDEETEALDTALQAASLRSAGAESAP